ATAEEVVPSSSITEEGPTLSPNPIDFPEPSALVPGDITGDSLEFNATSQSVEAASLLAFMLGGSTTPPTPVPSNNSHGAAQLLPLNDTTLPLLGTVLKVTLNTPVTTIPHDALVSETPGALSISFLPSASPSPGQSLSPADEAETRADSTSQGGPAVGQSF